MKLSSLSSTYTKHYYIGSERIASSIGTGNSVGYYLCDSNFSVQDYTVFLNQKMTQAAQSLQDDYDYFEKQLTLSQPFTGRPGCGISFMGPEIRYWFHPDLPIIIGMGSSSYISNDNGEISQHLEYLPFGETLVEEHKNSNNSPYKFNGKELDDETGNYYGARYLNPKWSFWLSVDPLVEKYPGWSPYNYTMLNPVRLVDPDGRSVNEADDIIFNSVDKDGNKRELGRIITEEFFQEFDINESIIPIVISNNYEPIEVELSSNKMLEKAMKTVGIQASSLDISGEAAYKIGAQIEISLIGIIGGENKGDWGIALQGNVLVGVEGSFTGSLSAYWPTSGQDLSLGDFRGIEYGLQGSVFGVSGAYFEGVGLKSSFPFVKTSYRGASLGYSVGIPELIGGSGSAYMGVSDFLYRSDK